MAVVFFVFAVAFATFIVGMIIYYYNRKGIANRILFTCSIVLSLWALSVGMNGVVRDGRIAYAWTNYQNIMVHFLPPLFAHLCLALSKKRLKRTLLLYLPSISIILGLLLKYGILVEGVKRGPFGFYPEVTPKWFILSWIYIGGWVGWGLLMLARQSRERIIFYGFGVSIGLGMVSSSLLYAILQRSSPGILPILYYTSPLWLVFFCGTVLYAMFRPDGFVNVRLRELLMDLLLNGMTYLCLIFMVSMLFFWVVWLVDTMWAPLNPAMVNLPALLVVVPVAIILRPRIYDVIYRLITTPKKHFWRERFTTFCLELKRKSTTKEVMDLLRERVPKLINTDRYYLFLYDEEKEDFTVVDTNLEDVKGKSLGMGQNSPLIQRINIGSTLKTLKRLEHELTFTEELSVLKGYGIELCLPIKNERMMGMVCFGEKKGVLDYDKEEREEISRLIYVDAFDHIRDFLQSIKKHPPYLLTFYIKGIQEEAILKKTEEVLDFILRPNAIRIKIVKEGKVLTEDFSLPPEKKIIFSYITYKAWANDVYDKWGNWRDVPTEARCFSDEFVSLDTLVAKRLMDCHKYLPQASRIRQWIGEIREELKALGAEDLLPKSLFGTKTKGYTINGKVILTKGGE